LFGGLLTFQQENQHEVSTVLRSEPRLLPMQSGLFHFRPASGGPPLVWCRPLNVCQPSRFSCKNVHARLAVIRGISANIRREKIENRAVTIESSRRGRIRQIEAKALTATRAPAGSS